jgi:hypothetical protein
MRRPVCVCLCVLRVCVCVCVCMYVCVCTIVSCSSVWRVYVHHLSMLRHHTLPPHTPLACRLSLSLSLSLSNSTHISDENPARARGKTLLLPYAIALVLALICVCGGEEVKCEQGACDVSSNAATDDGSLSYFTSITRVLALIFTHTHIRIYVSCIHIHTYICTESDMHTH